MEKVDRIEDLPDWFDLSKYQATKHFGAREWLVHISRRSTALQQIRLCKENSGFLIIAEPVNGDLMQLFKEFISDLRSDPLQIKNPANIFERTAAIEASTEYLSDFKPIRNLTLDLIVSQMQTDDLYTRDHPHRKDIAERWDYLLTPDRKWEDTPSLPFAVTNHHPSRWPEAAVLADLNAPDAVLISAFTHWLKKERRQQAENPLLNNPKKPFYDRWTAYGLLPFIDLCIWAEELELKVLDRVMVAAIMPRMDDGMDKLRKTIKPLAKDLWRLGAQLHPLASVEVEFSEA